MAYSGGGVKSKRSVSFWAPGEDIQRANANSERTDVIEVTDASGGVHAFDGQFIIHDISNLSSEHTKAFADDHLTVCDAIHETSKLIVDRVPISLNIRGVPNIRLRKKPYMVTRSDIDPDVIPTGGRGNVQTPALYTYIALGGPGDCAGGGSFEG